MLKGFRIMTSRFAYNLLSCDKKMLTCWQVENIVICQDGATERPVAKLIDFEMARHKDDEELCPGGTSAYNSPEKMRLCPKCLKMGCFNEQAAL